MEIKVDLNRQTVMDALIVLQLVLLLVFGWKLWSLSNQIETGGSAPKVVAEAPSPSPSAATPPTAGQVVNIPLKSDDHIMGDICWI